jgi:uncharacterized protein YndB with AHSA1/START domain
LLIQSGKPRLVQFRFKESATVFTFKTSRTFAATPEDVFAAFLTPSRLAKWWGPDGFRNTFETFELKPGGLWRFTMHGPDGANYPNEATFLSVEPARAVVIKHTSAPHFQLTIKLEGTASGTLVTWEQAFESPEISAAITHIVEPANEQNLNRWQAEVAAAASSAS